MSGRGRGRLDQRAVRPLLAVLIPEPPGPPNDAVASHVTSAPETIAFARRAAARTMVLLKNDGDLLPLPRTLRVRDDGVAGAPLLRSS